MPHRPHSQGHMSMYGIHKRGDILGDLCELVLGYDQRRVIDVDAEAFSRATLIP